MGNTDYHYYVISIRFALFFWNSFVANDCIYWLLHIGYAQICDFFGRIDARVWRISGASYMPSFGFHFDSIHDV